MIVSACINTSLRPVFEIVGVVAVALFGAAVVDSAFADDIVKLVNSVANLATVVLVVWLGARSKKTAKNVEAVKQEIVKDWDGKDRRNESPENPMDS